MSSAGDDPAAWVQVAVLVVVVLGAGLGALLRAVVLARVTASPSVRARTLGTAWVNVPASLVAAAVLVRQTSLGLLPGQAPAAVVLTAALVLGVCGGLSTWSALSLELARSLLAGDRRALRVQLSGVALGLLGGVFGAGLGAVTLLLR